MDNFNDAVDSTRNITHNHYTPRVDKQRDNYDILDWSDKGSQFKRFDVLSRNIDFAGKKLLDIGCGLGDLYRHLIEKDNLPHQYTGTDLVKVMIDLAKDQQPECDFICCDVFTEPPFSETFDIIYCSGVFNLRTHDNIKYLQYATANTKKLTHDESSVVFNFLHERTPKKYDHCYYYSPDKVTEIMQNYYHDVKIIDDYLINDFTVIATRRK